MVKQTAGNVTPPMGTGGRSTVDAGVGSAEKCSSALTNVVSVQPGRTIDSWLDEVAIEPSAAAGRDGRLHLAYSRIGVVRYGVWFEGKYDTIDIPMPAGFFPFLNTRLAISSEAAHVLYGAGRLSSIEYHVGTISSDGVLITSVLDDAVGGSMVKPPAIAAYGERVGAAWVGDGNGERPSLFYARNDEGSWKRERISSREFPQLGDSAIGLALLETKEGAYVSFYSVSSGQIFFAQKAQGGEWKIEVVSEIARNVRSTALAELSDGRILLSFKNEGLSVATFSKGAWTLETLDTRREVGSWSTIATKDCFPALIAYASDQDGSLWISQMPGGPMESPLVELEDALFTAMTLSRPSVDAAFLVWADAPRREKEEQRELGIKLLHLAIKDGRNE